jgi:hypothetical protein
MSLESNSKVREIRAGEMRLAHAVFENVHDVRMISVDNCTAYLVQA